MWKDILIVGAFVLACLMYFGLTPRRLSKYAKTAKSDLTKRSLLQKAYLIFLIAITPLFVFIIVFRFEAIGLLNFLLLIILFIHLWSITLIEVWKLKLRGRGEKVVKVVQAIALLAIFSLLITIVILSDMPLWQKFASPLIGIGIGIGINVLSEYLRKKRENELLSKEEGNK